MPKLGRRNDFSEIDYLCGPKEMTSRNAPFGTNDTPVVRTKIVGGRTVFVDDEEYSPRSLAAHHGLSLQDNTSKQAALPPIPRDSSPAPGYASANVDTHHSQIHAKSPTSIGSSGGLNPHRIVPPISAPVHLNYDSGDRVTIDQLLSKYSPRDNYLPREKVALNKHEDLLLRKKISEEMSTFNVHKLKDVYTTLTGFDHHLSGYVTFQDLSFTLVKSKVTVSADTLRLVAGMFVSELEPGKVNYEKVLSYLASCNRQQTAKPNTALSGMTREMDSPNMEMMQDDWEVTSIFTDDGAASLSSPPTSPRLFNKQGREVHDNAKLLRLLQIQLAGAGEDVDIGHMYSIFQAADRDHRGTMSKEQIKVLTYKCRLPLQDSVINQIVDRFKASNGQYQWQEYLMFLEKVLPSSTGLFLPQSKRPAEYMKHYTQPTENWPKAGDMSPRDGSQARASPGPAAAASLSGTSQRPDPPSAQSGERPAMPTSRSQSSQSQRSRTSSWNADERKSQLVQLSPGTEKFRLSQTPANSQQSMIDNLEAQLKQLEKEYEVTKKHLERKDEKVKVKKVNEDLPWIERFMKLANAMYANDTFNSGYLPVSDVRWVANQYNMTYNMKIPESKIEATLQKTRHNDKVALDAFLKILSMQEP